ncbi:MAG: ribbon-helix-helix domain-containing protein [archaeon]
MKIKMSISVEESTLEQVEHIVQNNRFRNKSHFIEMAIQTYLKKGGDERVPEKTD